MLETDQLAPRWFSSRTKHDTLQNIAGRQADGPGEPILEWLLFSLCSLQLTYHGVNCDGVSWDCDGEGISSEHHKNEKGESSLSIWLVVCTDRPCLILLLGWGYTRWPKVLGSLAHPPAQGARFPTVTK